VSVSSAVRWVQRFVATGIAAAKPSGGSTSPLEKHAEWLLELVAEQPDLTLDEIVAAMHKQRIVGSRTALWRFFERHKITFKKSACSRPSGIERTWLVSANAGFGSKVCWTRPGWCLSTRPPPPPTWPDPYFRMGRRAETEEPLMDLEPTARRTVSTILSRTNPGDSRPRTP
jgi:transposase